MPRKPTDDKPMTDAERQARCRAARAAGFGMRNSWCVTTCHWSSFLFVFTQI